MNIGSVIIILAATVVATSGQPEWSYTSPIGPNEWAKTGYSVCAGKTQTPVDIVKNDPSVKAGEKLSFADFTSYPAKSEFCIEQVKGAPTYICCSPGGCGSLVWNGVKYRLSQFHMHALSEHRIDGLAYPVEVHFVHLSKDGGIAVIGVLFKEDRADLTNRDLKAIFAKKSLLSEKGKEKIKIRVRSVIKGEKHFYYYRGSLTTPPCTEGVKWFVGKYSLSIDKRSFEKFWSKIGGFPGNARDTQPLNGRSIKYSV
uniref:Carbonic anhydrase n=1 Tax=Rhodosorus marinus TaxID=101924 RepID=A0A7S0BG41_9RHOD|mmetsp:Transcript_14901/g.21941  ORF Transcript_14901/g.21941 Transcript_14901/m.21941 type:complete len:256 (+) Transcript_14901:132-899(+)